MAYIPRLLTNSIAESLKDTPVLCLLGARQVGKSTLVEHLIPNASYISLDDDVAATAAAADPAGFIDVRQDRPLVIDEIQRAPELLRAIKLHVDRNRRSGSFVVTGSANVLTLPRLSETLAGRMEILTLRPLSQLEIESTTLPNTTFLDALFEDSLPQRRRTESRDAIIGRILRGGYPENLKRSEPRRESWFAAYIAGVLQREIRDVARVLDTGKLSTLLKMLAARSTQAINKTMLSRDLGLSWNTVESHLATLQATFMITAIPGWGKSVNPRAGQHPKILINDSGLAASMLRVKRDAHVNDMTVFGNILECFVGNELLRLASHQPYEWTVSHYRTQRNEEVDFVVERRDGQLAGVEVKLSNSITVSDFRGLRALQRDAGERFHRGVIMYTGEETASFGSGCYAVPITALWG